MNDPYLPPEEFTFGPYQLPVEHEWTFDENAFIAHWASELKKIYDNQTAGDYTFEGVVSKMLRDLHTPPKFELIFPKDNT